jgi:molybdopterin-guanine dinucleotide biosynthesis protein A
MKPSALILAGGESRRMGRDKAWIECHGQPLIRRALDTVRALGVAEVFISGRPDRDDAALGCPVLFDLEPGLGPLGGIERGLHHCVTSLLLVIPVDMPQLNQAVLAALLARCDTHKGAVPRLAGQIEPLVAVYPKRCHAFAFDRILRGSRAVQAFAEDCRREGALHLWNVPAIHSACFTNWNQPGDVIPARPHE